MGTGFVVRSPGLALIVTFVPGLAVATGIYVWMHVRRAELPRRSAFVPVYFATLGVQFVHVGELLHMRHGDPRSPDADRELNRRVRRARRGSRLRDPESPPTAGWRRSRRVPCAG